MYKIINKIYSEFTIPSNFGLILHGNYLDFSINFTSILNYRVGTRKGKQIRKSVFDMFLTSCPQALQIISQFVQIVRGPTQ